MIYTQLTTKLKMSKSAGEMIMAEPIQILIIGAGHMGGALAVGLERSSQDISITVIDPTPIRREEMAKMGIHASDSLPKKIESAAVTLAIPTQTFESLSKQCTRPKYFLKTWKNHLNKRRIAD